MKEEESERDVDKPVDLALVDLYGLNRVNFF